MFQLAIFAALESIEEETASDEEGSDEMASKIAAISALNRVKA